MVNKIEEFLNEKFGTLRATKDENGIIWFVAKDIADVLEYSLTTDMTRNLEEDEKGMQSLHTLGGIQDLTVINESGLYSVVLSITKRNKERYELAREFKRWVTGNVLPTLRQTGAYVETGREQEVVDKYFSGLSDDLKLTIFKELQTNNEKLKVKADKHDKFLDIESTHNFTEVAKMLSTKADEEYNNKFKISGIALTKYLREKGILSKNKNGKSYTNLPNQEFEQYFNVVSRNVKEDFSKSQTRVKMTGIGMIYDELVLDGFALN